MRGTGAKRLWLVVLLGVMGLLLMDTGVQAQDDDGQEDEEEIDLSGFWDDNGRAVLVTHAGNKVTAIYLRPYVCDHRDGNTSETVVDFEATLDGVTLTGETSSCYWDTNNPSSSGIVPAEMELTLSDDGSALNGTWYNSAQGEWSPFGLTRITCLLAVFNGDNFSGDQVVAEQSFVEILETLDGYAADNDVRIEVTSSFRTSTNVDGAIVDPAQGSNHLVGHAIDMNVWYENDAGNEVLCNSTCLGGDDVPDAVQGFLDDVRNDPDMRYGGDFNTPDVVHIDDGLNVNDADTWQAIYDEVQENPACFNETE